MSKFNFDIKTFGFEKDEVWDHIMFILEENTETEVLNAISVNVSDEKRASDIKKWLITTLEEDLNLFEFI